MTSSRLLAATLIFAASLYCGARAHAQQGAAPGWPDEDSYNSDSAYEAALDGDERIRRSYYRTRNEESSTPQETERARPESRERTPARQVPPTPSQLQTPASRTLPPARRAEKPSALESLYARRVVSNLPQYGYDLFGVPGPDTQRALDEAVSGHDRRDLMPMGAVQDDFILSAGDELEVVFSGQRSDRGVYKISSEGLLLIQDFPPIPAAGRSIGQVRISIDAAAGSLHNMETYVSLASVRQIGVLIAGHVKRPGRQVLTVFHTALDALMQAGGVEKTGSMRQIKLIRDGRSTIIDLYGLLIHGAANMDLQLRDGDRIIVPPIGPTVAVAGEVKRPAIYEILPTIRGMRHKPGSASEKLSLNDMLDLGGGVLVPGENRFLKLEITPQGQETVTQIHEPFEPVFGDGSILMVAKGSEERSGMVELEGHARRSGLHALDENNTLSRLLYDDKVLGPDIYPLIGVIERRDPEQLARTLLDFPLRLVMAGDYDRQLQDGDIVHLFSNRQIRNLAFDVPPHEEPEQGSSGTDSQTGDTAFIADEVMADFLRERSAFVRGAVRRPGAYPLAEGASLDNLLAVSGGLTLEASTGNIEVTSALSGEGHQKNGRSGTRRTHVNLRESRADDIMLAAGDSVRVNQKFQKIEDKSVLIIGEVQNPGRYDLLPGDKISDLLDRAGGLTQEAYPDGAIFSRDSERRAEEARFRSQARSIKQAVAAALEKDDEKISEAKIAEARSLADELENAQGIGRITVEADPALLAAQPELDLLLEAGDRLYVPKRNLTVRVSGEVLSPASLQFRQSKKSLDYIHEAGGFTFHADKDRTFVLYPDGSAQPIQVSAWNYNPVMIPPGSTLVVPRDPKPFDFIESARDISQILSNLAVTAIFIDDVRDDD